MNVSEIIVENRVRQAYGWLDSLERSIQQLGLLQPIGVTSDKRLIFGGRRLQACKNLGMKKIPVRIINIDADDPVTALRMEKVENDQRLDLTPSEKVEIARRIEESLAGRHGSNQYKQKEVEAQNFAEASDMEKIPQREKGESRDIAAKAVDMNRESYRQAKSVVDSGNREVIEQMDSGEKSIHAAYESVKPKKQPRTFKITLYKNPKDDAEIILMKGGGDYGTQLGIALLKAAGHNIEGVDTK